VTAKSSNDFTVWSNLGVITIDVSGAAGTVSYSNSTNCGIFSNFGTFITYEYQDCEPESGIMYFYIKDDTAESIDIEIQSGNITTATDTDLEGSLIFSTLGGTLSLVKSLSNISLGGSSITRIAPGSTVTYSLWYSNQGPSAINNVLIRDLLPGNAKYFDMDVIAGWSNQFTANPAPDQSYGSASYSNASAGVDPAIQFIRWKRLSLPAGATGKLIYKVIVK
jgi:uncharacterized repeat protein (TIGR01451 family)